MNEEMAGMVCGGYRAVARIGRGAHGEVYLAEGPEGRVALKVCARPVEAGRAAEWEREKRGWRLFAGIPPHPGLVKVYGTGETADGGAFWVAMELADPEPGGAEARDGTWRPRTLASLAEAEVALELGKCLEIGERLAGALEHLQRHHLLHRDVKPGNVLFARGRPVIADAGLVAVKKEAKWGDLKNLLKDQKTKQLRTVKALFFLGNCKKIRKNKEAFGLQCFSQFFIQRCFLLFGKMMQRFHRHRCIIGVFGKRHIKIRSQDQRHSLIGKLVAQCTDPDLRQFLHRLVGNTSQTQRSHKCELRVF